MSYRVLLYKKGVRERELWRNYTLHACQQHGRHLVAGGVAEKVKIYNLEGKLVGQYPRRAAAG